MDIPLLRTKQTVANDNSCGIHCMCIPRDSRRFLATGGYDPNNVALYRLPDFDPLTLGVVSHVIAVYVSLLKLISP